MFGKFKNYIINRISGKDMETIFFNEAYNLIIIGIGATLFNEYLKEMEFDKAQVLSSQVVNYLMGYDINRIIDEAEEPLKSRIETIKDIVKDRAFKAMDNDPEIREVVINYLIYQTLFGQYHIDKGYKEKFTFVEIIQARFLVKRCTQKVTMFGGDIGKFFEAAKKFGQTRASQYPASK